MSANDDKNRLSIELTTVRAGISLPASFLKEDSEFKKIVEETRQKDVIHENPEYKLLVEAFSKAETETVRNLIKDLMKQMEMENQPVDEIEINEVNIKSKNIETNVYVYGK